MKHPAPHGSAAAAANPLLQDWTAPYGLPPFPQVLPEHFEPAYEIAMKAQVDEIDAIAANPEPPSFDNTVAALDRSGRLYTRIDHLFGSLTASETSPALQAVQRELAGRTAAHENAITLHQGLFERIDQLHARRESLGLDDQSRRLLERFHLDFVLAGATLPPAARARSAGITGELADLCTQFAQNLLADEAGWLLQLEGEAELAGLPEPVRSAARGAAQQRGLAAGAHAVTLSPSLAEPFLTFSARRDLREKVWRARVQRGANGGEHDNRAIAARIVELRLEQAVLDLLKKAWEPAKQKAGEDRVLLTQMAQRLGAPTPIAAWDWRYLAEKVRQDRFDLDEAELKPYFALDNMIAAMFDCAGRLFGLQFVDQQQQLRQGQPHAAQFRRRTHAVP